jgi:hypothetical protein
MQTAAPIVLVCGMLLVVAGMFAREHEAASTVLVWLGMPVLLIGTGMLIGVS